MVTEAEASELGGFYVTSPQGGVCPKEKKCQELKSRLQQKMRPTADIINERTIEAR